MLSDKEQKLMLKLNDVNNEAHNLRIENTKLKELLEEYKDITATAMLYTKSDEEYAKAKTVRERIDQVLANNKIQANTVACNKIQENK